MVKITLENVNKYFGKVKAVNNLNLEINDKEFMVLLGPSGCGKTTTLRIIAGLEKPTSGNVYFDGKLVNDLKPKERNVAMVFQDYALYPHMSVFDNISLCLKVRKIPKDEIKKRVKEVAELLQIEELLSRKPWELSGGQKQRVALARAIVRKPMVYLLDEPLSNLDAILRAKMREELKKLHEKLRTTTIYVTHDQAEAMVMADRIAVMKNGNLLQIGKPREIYDRPINKFIAEFIGVPVMNFIECELLSREDGLYLDTGFFLLKISKNLSSCLEKFLDSTIILGIRPEHVYVFTEKKDEDLVEAKVWLIQQMGNISYVSLELGQNLIITAKVDPFFNIEKGGKVFIKFDEKFMHFFDKRTENAIF